MEVLVMNGKRASAIVVALAMAAGFLPSTSAAPKAEAFTDPEKAGPDFLVQGEYEGPASGGGKLGAQVVALGDGSFDCYFLGGGLPGAGWDQKTRVKTPGKTDGGKTAVEGGGWSGVIADGKLTGKTPDGAAFTLARTIRQSPTLGEKPPPGAVVLFDGTNADAWQNGKRVDGNLLNWGVTSKQKFGDLKLHLEFRLSFMPKARGQGRSNSGCYLAGRHEVQILDSFGLTGEQNECGGLYGVSKPAVNMCFPPLSWQTYDIEYRLAKEGSGARMTVHHNGVKIQENAEFKKKTTAAPDKGADDTPGPVYLQDHGNPVVFRNIWVVEMK
jgi:hypothetical protein